MLWAVFVVVAIAATMYGLKVVTDSVSKIVVAVVTGTFGIMVAIVTHAMTQLRERELEAWRKKQERYALILERLGSFVRDRTENNDTFASAVLQSYVVAAPSVIVAVRAFMRTPEAQSLDEVVTAMRSDLELALLPVDSGVEPRGGLTRPLFPIAKPAEPKGGFQ